jgi:plasmid stabilization system protein ParE
MKYSFHPHAEKELEEIRKYYDSQDGVLGENFRAEFQKAISRILSFPHGWHPLSRDIRRCTLNVFPYGLIYRIRKDEIRILTIAHQNREPNYWKDRR